MWQHRHVHLLALTIGMVLPTVVGAIWDGWDGALGGLLLGGVAKPSSFSTAHFSLTPPVTPSVASLIPRDAARAIHS